MLKNSHFGDEAIIKLICYTSVACHLTYKEPIIEVFISWFSPCTAIKNNIAIFNIPPSSYQEYRMSCFLCGTGEDSVSVLPRDPRKVAAAEW